MADEGTDVDLLVVGSGKAGKSLAMDQARAGRRVVMVEREMIGGTCINVACIPTKSLVASARAERTIQRAKELGLVIGGAHTDVDGLRQHTSGVVEGMIAANLEQFRASGLELVMGTARFVAKRTVEVELNEGGLRRIRGQDVVINTGTRPAVPDIPGLRGAHPWTSNKMVTVRPFPTGSSCSAVDTSAWNSRDVRDLRFPRDDRRERSPFAHARGRGRGGGHNGIVHA